MQARLDAAEGRARDAEERARAAEERGASAERTAEAMRSAISVVRGVINQAKNAVSGIFDADSCSIGRVSQIARLLAVLFLGNANQRNRLVA